MEADQGAVQPDAPTTYTFDGPTAAAIIQTLEMIASLPSTPSPISAEARQLAGDLGMAQPQRPHAMGPGARPPMDAITVPAIQATAAAGLLELTSGMPSTPPDVADAALEFADAIWAELHGS